MLKGTTMWTCFLMYILFWYLLAHVPRPIAFGHFIAVMELGLRLVTTVVALGLRGCKMVSEHASDVHSWCRGMWRSWRTRPESLGLLSHCLAPCSVTIPPLFADTCGRV